MNNQKAIEILTAKAECIRREASGTDIDCKFRNCDECDLCYKQGTTGDQMEALYVAISALQAQDSETKRICDTCKYDPPSKKWPCVDCDMREPADRWEKQDVPDTNVGDMKTQLPAKVQQNLQPACNKLAIDTISRQAAIEEIRRHGVGSFDFEDYTPEQAERFVIKLLQDLPSVTPEPCEDAVSRAAVIDLIEASDLDLADRTDNQAVCSFVKMIPPVTPKQELLESDEAVKRLNDLIFDINPCEICSQIESGNLSDWCKTIQTEMKMAMVQLPCWEGL